MTCTKTKQNHTKMRKKLVSRPTLNNEKDTYFIISDESIIASIANQLKFLKVRATYVGRNKYILNWYRKHHYCVRMTQSNLKAGGAFSGYDGSPAIMFYKLGHNIWLINTIWNLYIRRSVTLYVILLMVNNRRYFGFCITVINHVAYIVDLFNKRFKNVSD